MLIPFHLLHAEDTKVKDTYQAVEISPLEVAEGVEIPPNQLPVIQQDVLIALQNTKKFQQVFIDGEGGTPGNPDLRTLQLSGTVTTWKKESRFARYMMGPVALAGPGQTKVEVGIQIADRATGEVLFTDDVDGTVSMGVLGGDSMGAARDVAKEVAKVVTKKFFSKLRDSVVNILCSGGYVR